MSLKHEPFSEQVTFYRNLEMLGTSPLPLAITDCFNNDEGVLMGSAGATSEIRLPRVQRNCSGMGLECFSSHESAWAPPVLNPEPGTINHFTTP